MKQEPTLVSKNITIIRSTIETIDQAMFEWLDKEINLFSSLHDGFSKVPVIWVSAERAFMSKRKREIRGAKGELNYPIITLERVSVDKDPAFKGTAYANIPSVNDAKGGSITIARRIKQDKTSNFANADAKRTRGQINFPRKNEKVVYETISIPMPVYVTVMYQISIKSQYQGQMNELVQPLINVGGGINYFLISWEKQRFEAFVQPSFKQTGNANNLSDKERMFETKIDIKVLGHLVGNDKNQESPQVVIRENAVDVKIPREHSVFEDLPDHKSDTGYVGIKDIKG